MSRLLFLPPIQLIKLFVVITSFLRCAAKQQGEQSALFNLELCCTCYFTGEHNYLLHGLLHLRSGICEFVKRHAFTEVIVIIFIKVDTFVCTVNFFFHNDCSPMIYHDMTFKLTRITGTIIAVAQFVCVKPLGKRFPINPQTRKNAS